MRLTPLQIEARDRLWRKGSLRWMLRPWQRDAYDRIRASGSLKFVANVARRSGKSFLFCVMATEDAIRRPQWPVRLIAPDQKRMRRIIRPHMRAIFSTAPLDMRPKFNTNEGIYFWPNKGAELQITGVNNGHEDDPRGTAMGSGYMDEAGYMKQLEYVISDVLMPQLFDTNGFLVIGSTPPKTPAHFFVQLAQEAEKAGAYVKRTAHEVGNPPDRVEKFCREAGGKDSTTWRREYLCEFVVDKNFAIVPEWDDSYIQEWPRDGFREFYQNYEGMDIGVRHKTVNLFGHYDFKKAKFYFEDEFAIRGPEVTTSRIAELTKAKEKEVFGEWPVFRRIADNNNLILLADLSTEHGLIFAPVSKESTPAGTTNTEGRLKAMVNWFRMWVGAGRIAVHPRCKELIGCLKYGIWTENRKVFEENPIYGHFDALAAAIYLVRNIDEVTNPIPAMHGIRTDQWHVQGNFGKNKEDEAIAEALLSGFMDE